MQSTFNLSGKKKIVFNPVSKITTDSKSNLKSNNSSLNTWGGGGVTLDEIMGDINDQEAVSRDCKPPFFRNRTHLYTLSNS